MYKFELSLYPIHFWSDIFCEISLPIQYSLAKYKFKMLHQMDDQDLRGTQDAFVMTEFNRQDKINEPIRLLLCRRYEEFHEILMRLYSSDAPAASHRKIESFEFLKMREGERIEGVLEQQLAELVINAQGTPRYLEHDSQIVLHRFIRRLYFDKKHSLSKCKSVLEAYNIFAGRLTHVEDISEFLKLMLEVTHAIREEVFNEVQKLFVEPEHRRTSIFEKAYSGFDEEQKLILELAYAKNLEALGRLHFDWSSVSQKVVEKVLRQPSQRLISYIGRSCINITNLKLIEQLTKGKIIADFENNTYILETDQLHQDIRGQQTIKQLLTGIYAGSYLKMLSHNPLQIVQNTIKLKYRIQFLDKMLELLSEDELELLPDIESFGKLVHAFKSMLDHHKYKFISVNEGTHKDQYYNFKYICKFFVLIEKLYGKEDENGMSQFSQGLFLHWVRVLNEWIIYYKLQQQPFIQKSVQSIFTFFFSVVISEHGDFVDFPTVLDENSELSQQIKKLIIGLDTFPRNWEACIGFKRLLFGWGVAVSNQTPEMQIILQKFLSSVFSNQNTVVSTNYSLDFFQSPSISKVFKKMVSSEVLKCLQREAGNLIKDGVSSKKHNKYLQYSNFISKIAMIIATKMPFEYIDRIVRNIYEIYINCAHIWPLLGCFRLWILQIYQQPNDNHLQRRLKQVKEIFHQFEGNLDQDIRENKISTETSELFAKFENVANPLINCMHLKKNKQAYSQQFYKRYFQFVLHVEEKSKEWVGFWSAGENQYNSWVSLGVNLQSELQKIKTELGLSIRYYLCNSTKLLNYNEEDIILRQISALYMKVISENAANSETWKLINSFLGFNERNYKVSLLQSRQLLGNHHRYTTRFNPTLKIDDFAPFNFYSCLYSYIRPHFPHLLKISFEAIYSGKVLQTQSIWQNLEKILFMPVNISGSCLFNGKHHSKSKQEMVFGIYGQQYKIMSDILTEIKEGSKTNITIVLQLQKRKILSKFFDTVRLKTTKITEKARNLENMNRFRARQVQSPEEIFNNISQLGIQREYIEVALRNVEVPDENQVLNWIDNHREQLEEEVLSQALFNSSGIQRRGSSQPQQQERSGNSIPQLNLQAFKKQINGQPLKNWVKFIFKQLFQHVSIEQIYRIKDILFMFLDFFDATLKKKQFKNLNDRIYNDLDALNKESDIKLKLCLLISIMQTLSDKYPTSKSDFYKKSINMKALSFLGKLQTQQDQAKIFGLINTYLPVITPQILSPEMQAYLEYLLDVTLVYKIADKNITQIFLKIAKANKQSLIERITRNIVQYLASGLISQNIVPIIQIIFESDKELSLVNAELDLKSYIYERYLHVINSFHPDKEHVIEVDGTQLAENFSKYEKDSAIYEVSKKILKKKKNKNRFFSYDCRRQQNAFDYSSYLKAPFITARLKGFQQTIVRSLISILINSSETQQEELLVQLHKILTFYRVLIPFALKQRVNNTTLLEWLINSPNNNKRKYKLLLFLCLNNNIFIRANEDSLYSFYSIADYSCSKIIETLVSRKYELEEYHAIISCLYLQQVKRFSDFSEVCFEKESSQNLVTFLEKFILNASPMQQLVLSQILNIQYKKSLVNNLKRKYKIAQSEKQPTFMRQFLSLSSFYNSLAIKISQPKTKTVSNPMSLAVRWNQERQNSQSDEQQEQRPIIFQLNDGGLEYPGRRALIGSDPDVVEQFLVPIFKKQQKEKEKDKQVDLTQFVPVVATYNFTISEIINRFEQFLDFQMEVAENFNVPSAIVPQSIIQVGENTPCKIVIPEGNIDIDIRVNKNFNFQKRFTDLTRILDPTCSWEQKKVVSPQERRVHEISRRIFAQDPNMTLQSRHDMLQQLERLVASRQSRLVQQLQPQQQARILNINEIYTQSGEFTEPIRPIVPPKQEKMVIEEPMKVEQIAQSKINQQVKVVQNEQVVEQIPIEPVVNNPPAAEQMEIQEPVQHSVIENLLEIPPNPALIIQQQAPVQIQQPQQALLIIPPEPENLVPQIDRQILRVFNLPQTFLRDAGIDQMAFDCLPEQLQQQQLMQIISQQNRGPIPPPNRNPAQQGQQGNQVPAVDQLHQNVIFLAGLDYETRVQVLLEANPQFLATLPEPIRQEADALRHHQISRLIDQEDLREEEKRVENVKQRLKIPPPKVYKEQFSNINDEAAKKIFEGVLYVIPNFKMAALKILLENKQTQGKAIMSIIGFLRYLQAIKNKKLFRLKKVIKEEKVNRIVQTFDWSEQDIKNIRLSLLHTVYETFKIPIYHDEDFLAQTVKKQFYLEDLANFFGQDEIIDPKIQLLEHSLRYYPTLSCELIKKLKDLPDNILKRLVQAMKNDTLPDQFYPNLQNFSDNERLKQYFAAAFENQKPKIQILGKVLKYKFSHLPNLRKIHQQALEYFSNTYYQFLNQIFRIYTLQTLVEIEPILTKHKQIHFQVIKYLLQSGKEIDKEPIGILLKKPHLLDFQTKKFIFRNHPKIRKLSRHRVHIEVDRTHIFQGSYNQLMSRSVRELQGRIQVSFLNEAGYDAGGLKRQWFLIVSREIFNQDYALFEKSSSGSTYQPNPKSYVNPDHLNYFKFIGRFIGKALVQRQLIDAYFTRAFYKIILGQQLQFKDLQAQDYEFYKSMEWLKNNPIDADMFTFSYFYDNFGNKIEKEIIPGGKTIIVNEQNKKEFIEKYCLAKMRDDFSSQINKFLQGFYQIIPQQCISFFEAKQLQLLMSGVPEVDVEDLKNNTDYSGYNPTDQIIVWFWEVIEEYSQQSLAKLVQFITGTSKIPVEGFSQIVGMNGIQRISIHRDPNQHQLPKSHTCFNQLDLPNYASKEILREKMAICLAWGSQGFGFM